MYKKCKKILSLFMAMVIVLSSFPIESLADDYSGEDIREEVQERSKLIKNYLQNGSFEQVGSRWPGDFDYYDESQIQGWQTTRLISSGEYLGYIIEVTDGLEGKNVGTIRAREGNKFAELNAIEVGALYQSVKTPAPKNENEELVMRWRLYHQGRDGTDRMNVNIFDADLAKNKSKIIDKKKVEEIVNGSGYFDKMDITAIETGQKWKEYTGTYVVPRSQSETLFVFDSAKSASPSPSIGNLLDGIVFEESEMEISKESNVIGNTSEKDRSVVPGQRIEYRINAKNISRLDTTGSIVDKLPKGVKLIPESARITVNGQEALLNLEYLEETRELKFNDINFNKINDNSSTGITDDTDYTISYEVEVLNELDGITKIEGTEVELEYFDRDYRQSDFEKYGKVHTWTLKDKNEGHYLKGKLSAEKVSSKEIVKPDEIVKYTIKIENIVQNTEIEEIRVRDKLPKDVQYIEGTGRINGRSINPENIENNTLLFNISEVLGEDIVLTYDVKILANAHGKLVNQAVISGKSKIADSLIDDIRVETTIEAPESMYLSKTADKDDARIGDIVEYDINISNLGGKWSGNIEVIDKLPFGVEYQNNTSYIDGKKVEDTPIWKDNKLLIPNLEVKADKVVNVKFKVKVTEGVITGNSIINEVRAIDKLTGEEIKNESSDESKHKVLILPEIGELECEKKVFFKDGKELKENKLAKIGDKLSYEVTGKNTGDANSKIEDIEIIDRLPDGLKVVENTVSLFINDKEIKNLDISLTGKNKIIRVKPFALSKGDRFTLKYDVNVEFNAKNEEKNTAEIKGINAHTKEVLRKEVDNSIYVKTAVEILKSVNKEQVKIGESFDYRLDVENKTGGAYWSGIISDTLAEGLKLNKLFIDGIEIDKNNKNLVEINGQEIRIKGISLSSGEKKRIVLRVEADASLSNKEVENIALGYEVGMNGVVESTEIKSNKVLVKILGNLGSLDGSKKVFNKDKTELEDKALVKIGDTLSYKIRVENKGAIYSRIKNVTVEDIIPEALKLDEDSVRVVQDGKAIDCKKLVEDNILKIELPNINSGKYFEIEYDASVVDTEKTLISNTANIEGRDYYTDKAMTKTVSSLVSVKPDISISKSSNLESVKVGEEFEYTISLRNNLGGAIWKGSIEDSLAEGLEIVSSKDLEVDGQLVRIDNISLKSGEEKIVKIRVKADGSLSNKVVENIGLAKDREGNILESNKVLVKILGNLGSLDGSKKVFNKDKTELEDKALVKIGDTLSYKIRVENKGAIYSRIKNVTVEDIIPEALKLDEDSVRVVQDGKVIDCKKLVEDNILKIELPNINSGKYFEIEYDASVVDTEKTLISNTANIEGRDYYTDKAMIKTVSSSVSVKPDISISKSSNLESVKVGEEFEYTISLRNNLGGAIWKGSIEDSLAEGLEIVSSKDLEVDGQIVRIDNISLKSGEEKIVKIRVKADGSLSNKVVENIGLAKDREGNILESNKVLVKILGNLGSLDGSKKVFDKDKTELEDKALVKIGDTLSYKIRVENKGAIYSRIKNVTVEDIIPEALKLDEDSVRVVQDGKVIDCKKLVEDNILKIELPNINSDKYFEIEYDASVVDTEKILINNTANIEGRDYYTDKAMIKTVSSSVSVKPDISISKSSNLESVKVGEEFEYTISLRNNLGGAIWKGSIEDSLAEGLEIVSSKDLEVDGQLVRIDNISLKSGEEKIVKIRVKADGSLSNKVVENIGLAKDREGNILETNKVLVNVKEVPKPVEEDKGRPIDFKSGEYIIKHVYIDKDAKLIDLLPEIKKTAFVGEKISVKAEDTSKDIDFSKYELIGPKEVEIVIKDKKQEVVFKYEDIKLNKNEHFAYLQGYPDGTIRPLANITREEVSAVIFRILDRDYRDTIRKTDNNYRDVKSNRWSNKHISTLDEGKIIKGYKDGSFRPQNKITRAEVMAMVVRFTNESIENKNIDKNSFKDIKGHWAEGYIVHGEDRGWIKGYEDGSFKPDDYITRAEFVVIINNLLDRSTKLEHMLDDRKEFIDLEEGKWYYEDMQEAINSHEHIYEDGYEIWTALKEFDVEM